MYRFVSQVNVKIHSLLTWLTQLIKSQLITWLKMDILILFIILCMLVRGGEVRQHQSEDLFRTSSVCLSNYLCVCNAFMVKRVFMKFGITFTKRLFHFCFNNYSYKRTAGGLYYTYCPAFGNIRLSVCVKHSYTAKHVENRREF